MLCQKRVPPDAAPKLTSSTAPHLNTCVFTYFKNISNLLTAVPHALRLVHGMCPSPPHKRLQLIVALLDALRFILERHAR